MNAKLIGWTAAGLAGVGVFAGVANAAVDSSTPSGASSAASSAVPAVASVPAAAHPQVSQKLIARVERRLVAGAARGEIVLDTKKGVQTVDFQRGTTSGTSSTGVTVTDKTGVAQEWTVSATTKIRERGTSSPQLADGENVVVVGLKSDNTLTARLILVVPAKPTAQAKPTAPTSDQSTT